MQQEGAGQIVETWKRRGHCLIERKQLGLFGFALI